MAAWQVELARRQRTPAHRRPRSDRGFAPIPRARSAP